MDRGETARRVVSEGHYRGWKEQRRCAPSSRSPSPITSPPAAPIVDQLLRPSYKTINAYRGPRRPVT